MRKGQKQHGKGMEGRSKKGQNKDGKGTEEGWERDRRRMVKKGQQKNGKVTEEMRKGKKKDGEGQNKDGKETEMKIMDK